MPSEGFEPAIPVIERPQTHALDRADRRIYNIYGEYTCMRWIEQMSSDKTDSAE